MKCFNEHNRKMCLCGIVVTHCYTIDESYFSIKKSNDNDSSKSQLVTVIRTLLERFVVLERRYGALAAIKLPTLHIRGYTPHATIMRPRASNHWYTSVVNFYVMASVHSSPAKGWNTELRLSFWRIGREPSAHMSEYASERLWGLSQLISLGWGWLNETHKSGLCNSQSKAEWGKHY